MTSVQNKDGRRIKISPSTKGAISEHIATAWLLQQGYDVFRNVSPNGRADLLAINWSSNKTIRVDVKSQGFMHGGDARSASDARKIDLNQGFDIEYLIVNNDGSCEWYDESDKGDDAANDNIKPSCQWWRDRKTMQRYLMPGNHMESKSWTYFCHWLVRAYPDYIVPFKEEFVRDISSRGIGNDRPYLSEKEIAVLNKLYKHVYDKLLEANMVDHITDLARAA